MKKISQFFNSESDIKDVSNFGLDVTWSMFSFIAQSIFGAILTFSLYFIFGSQHLGVFTQLYAIFVVLGQLFVFGLNDSVLKHAAGHQSDKVKTAKLFCTAVTIAVPISLFGSVALFLFAKFFGTAFFSKEVNTGIALLAFSFVFFVLNKICFALLNGIQRFGRLSILQALRAFLLVLLILFCCVVKLDLSYFGLCFFLVELLLFLTLVDIFIENIGIILRANKVWCEFKKWTWLHVRFGFLSAPHGFLSETFIRVDILVLSFFLNDKVVGIYGLASFFLEGVYQVSVFVRNVTNPRLVKVIEKADIKGLKKIFIRSSLISASMTGMCVILVFLVAFVASQLIVINNLNQILNILYILLSGLIVHSLIVPIDSILLQGGKPGWQSVYYSIIAISNLALNVLLIPSFGLYGAAFGTAVAMSLAIIILPFFILFPLKIRNW